MKNFWSKMERFWSKVEQRLLQQHVVLRFERLQRRWATKHEAA